MAAIATIWIDTLVGLKSRPLMREGLAHPFFSAYLLQADGIRGAHFKLTAVRRL